MRFRNRLLSQVTILESSKPSVLITKNFPNAVSMKELRQKMARQGLFPNSIIKGEYDTWNNRMVVAKQVYCVATGYRIVRVGGLLG